MKNKCSNKIALSSNTIIYYRKHSQHTYTHANIERCEVRPTNKKIWFEKKNESTKKPIDGNLEFRFNIGDLFLFAWHFSDMLVEFIVVVFVVVVVVHFYVCALAYLYPSVYIPELGCCSSDSCCRFPFCVMIHTAYQNEMSRKNDRIKISTA